METLGFNNVEFKKFIYSRVDLFINNEPTRQSKSARASAKFPSLSQSKFEKYQQLCSARADLLEESKRLDVSVYELELSRNEKNLQNV